MSNDTALSFEGLKALQQRFEAHSRKAQAYYAVMHKIKKKVRTDETAHAWMNESLANFGGKTPAQLVNEGREEALVAYITSLKS